MDRLLERDAELEALSAAAAEGRCVLVMGEAGIGKTSLLRALRARVGRPFRVGRCEPLQRDATER